jgi:hypothetical protein
MSLLNKLKRKEKMLWVIAKDNDMTVEEYLKMKNGEY